MVFPTATPHTLDLRLIDELPRNGELVYNDRDPEFPVLRKIAAKLFDSPERGIDAVHITKFRRAPGVGTNDLTTTTAIYLSASPSLGANAGRLFERALERDDLIRLWLEAESTMLTVGPVPSFRVQVLVDAKLAEDGSGGADLLLESAEGKRLHVTLSSEHRIALGNALAHMGGIPTG